MKKISDEIYQKLVKIASTFSAEDAESYCPGDSGNYDDEYSIGSDHGAGYLAVDVLEDIEKVEGGE